LEGAGNRESQEVPRIQKFNLNMKSMFPKYAVAAIVGIFGYMGVLYAEEPQQQKDVPTIEDAKIFHEAKVWVTKAEALMETAKENSDEQAGYYLKATQINPDFLEAHYNLGLIYIHQEKMKEAAHAFEAVLKIEQDPKVEGIHFLLASVYQELGNSDMAMDALDRGLQLNPDNWEMRKAIASLQINARSDAAAIRNLLKLIEYDPTDITVRIDLALLYQRNNKMEKAFEQYSIVTEVDSENYMAHLNLALIYMRQKKYKEAAGRFETADRIQPDNPVLLERLGDAYAGQQLLEKAVVTYTSALENASEKGSLYTKLGFSLASLNRLEEAVAALENSIQIDASNPDIFYLLGDLYSDLERNDDAVTAYRQSLELKPDQMEVRHNLGTLYAEKELLPEALLQLRAALELDPDYVPAWNNIALVSEKLGLDDEAIQAHEKIIALGQGRAIHFFHLGILYAKAEKTDPSIEAFARAIELEPEKYRSLLLQELQKVHSVLDPVRYDKRFLQILEEPVLP